MRQACYEQLAICWGVQYRSDRQYPKLLGCKQLQVIRKELAVLTPQVQRDSVDQLDCSQGVFASQ